MIINLNEKEADAVLDALSSSLSGMTGSAGGAGSEERLAVETAAAKVKRAAATEWPRYVSRGCALFSGWPVEAVEDIRQALSSKFAGFGDCGRDHKLYGMYRFLHEVQAMYDAMMPSGMGEKSGSSDEEELAKRASLCRCIVEDAVDGTADLAVYNTEGAFPESVLEYIALYEAVKHGIGPGNGAVVSHASYLDGIGQGMETASRVSDLNGGIVYVSMVGISSERRNSIGYADVTKAVMRSALEPGGSDTLVLDAYEMLSICCNEQIYDREVVELGLKLVDRVPKSNGLYTEYELRSGMLPFLRDTLSKMDREEQSDGPHS